MLRLLQRFCARHEARHISQHNFDRTLCACTGGLILITKIVSTSSFDTFYFEDLNIFPGRFQQVENVY